MLRLQDNLANDNSCHDAPRLTIHERDLSSNPHLRAWSHAFLEHLHPHHIAAARVSFAICLTFFAPSEMPGSSTSKGSNPIARIPSRLRMFSFLAPWSSCAFSSSYRYPSPLKSLGGFASRKLCREARRESMLYGDSGVQAL